MGKMTDGQVRLMLGRCAEPMRSTLRAHIAALEDEREAMRAEARGAMTALLELAMALTDDRNEPAIDAARRVVAERDEALKDAERADTAAVRNVEELDSLRERVKALKYEATTQRTWQEVAEARAVQAELARDRAKEAVEQRHRQLLDAESRLAAMRQRAGDEQALGRVIIEIRGGRFDVARAVARYILGDDAPAHVITKDAVRNGTTPTSACESCGEDGRPLVTNPAGTYCADVCALRPGNGGSAPSEMDGLEGEMAERPPLKHDGPCQPPSEPSIADPDDEPLSPSDEALIQRGWERLSSNGGQLCGAWGCTKPSCHKDSCNTGSMPTEPTTAEAFVKLRGFLREDYDPEEFTDLSASLSLLECRMGEQTRVLEALKAAHVRGADLGVAWWLWRDVDTALTGAPPVFTLEEVVAAASPYIPPKYRADYQHDLEGLRKNTHKEESCSKPLPSS